MYIRDSSAAVVVFDLCNRNSFEQVSHWVDSVRSERDQDALVFLVGNKSDRPVEDRQVTAEEAAKLAASLKVSYTETSAKTGHNVKEFFAEVGRMLVQKDLAAQQQQQQQQQKGQASSSSSSNVVDIQAYSGSSGSSSGKRSSSGSAGKGGKAGGNRKCCF